MIEFTLPTDSEERKNLPVAGGCRDYFPAALAGVARWSKLGNDKHNPGEPLHHARGKSMDHEECIERHSMDLADLQAAYRRTADVATGRRLVQLMLDEYDARAWRALAASQEFREAHGLAPLAPAARLPTSVQDVIPAGIPDIEVADTPEPCGAHYHGWHCTEPRGHNGCHKAGGFDSGSLYAQWR